MPRLRDRLPVRRRVPPPAGRRPAVRRGEGGAAVARAGPAPADPLGRTPPGAVLGGVGRGPAVRPAPVSVAPSKSEHSQSPPPRGEGSGGGGLSPKNPGSAPTARRGRRHGEPPTPIPSP